ncbi:MAG: NINE protein [Verrucomicrobiae bacterium]|nr:NINE protein [Verrucomicrobiae bacterium]
MYCRNCGKQIDEKAVVCVHCGVPPKLEKNFCNNCGTATKPNQTLCTSCGVALAGSKGEKSKIVAGLFALLLGTFGAHKFYLGYTTEAIIVLVTVWGGLILAGIPTLIMAVIVLIEGIIYLTKSDQDFQNIYVDNKKGWF